MTTNETLAYLAGLIDGECCIGAYNVRQKSSTKSPYAQITITTCMVTPFAVKLLQAVFGGTIKAMTKTGNRRQTFHWCVRNREAESCLRAVLPFLREKREQAEVALSLAELRRSRGHTLQLTDEEIADREQYVQMLKNLKRVEYPSTAIQ